MNHESTLDTVASRLARARRVLFLTGAGISADSGLPTYRGVGGLYEDGLTVEGLRIEQALSGEIFGVRPDITWKYLAQIERNSRGAEPNAAHRAIAGLEKRILEVSVFTQNVDGLHRKAGSSRVIEVHGNLNERYCTHCGADHDAGDLADQGVPPRCATCGGVVRPKVVLFGEALPAGAIDTLLAIISGGLDMLFAIGTSAAFPYIEQPVLWAKGQGITTVEINPGETRISGRVDHRLRCGAADAMSALTARLDIPPASR
jgi:NAD-dependent deacetylase